MSDQEPQPRDLPMTATHIGDDGEVYETQVIFDSETGETVQLGDELTADAQEFLNMMSSEAKKRGQN